MSKTPDHKIINDASKQIHIIRNQRVMMDSDLARLYEVPTKALNQAVKRNLARFPNDFMFQLNEEETKNWKSQIVTSNLKAKMGLRKNPYAFTELGVAMLSSVLNSRQAIRVNIEIMRTFVYLRQIDSAHRELLIKISELEQRYDKQFQAVFKAIKLLLADKPSSGDSRDKRF